MRKLLVALVVVALGLVPTTARASGPEAADRPNILLINTDDQRADTLDVMPKLRRWFADGRTFTRSLVNIPSCCPSRATLFSGDYPHNHGVRHQVDAKNLDVDATLPGYLSRAGYRTAMAGKYLNSWPLEQAPPHFDRFSSIHGGYQPFNVLDSELSPNRKMHVKEYSTTWLGGRLESFIESFQREKSEKTDRPWFAYYAPVAPHRPWQPEAKYADYPVRECLEPDELDRSDKPRYIQRHRYEPDEFRRICENSLRALMSVDDAVDSLLRRIDSLGALDNTLVIYTSDNGYLWGAHGRDSKFAPYLQAMRVPLLMRWPGRIPRGEDSRLVTTVDVLPTVLDAAGESVPPQAKGLSLLKEQAHETVFSEYFYDDHNGGIPDWAASFDGRRHYIETYADSGEIAFVELYDTEVDPGEDENIATEDNVQRLHEQLLQWRRS
ncbi:MAG TPA: sulfatase [Candidatus Limnocylindrales bacterium]